MQQNIMKDHFKKSEEAAITHLGCGVRTLDDEEDDDGVDEGCGWWL